MKLNGVKINKKNFWTPFLFSISIPFLIWLAIFISSIFVSITLNNIGINLVSILFHAIPILLVISIPSFFIIKRLLSKKPKKVFYFELPILFVIYSFFGALNMFTGLMFGGPMGMSKLSILIFILSPLPFILLWISLLTISLYFYYKKKSLLGLSPIKPKHLKLNLSLKSFWVPSLISSILSFLLYFFGVSFTSYVTERILVGEINLPYINYLPTYPLFLIPIILMTIIPSFFIIRRLLFKNPKKVFYFELPLFIVIYSIFSNYPAFTNFIFGELTDIPVLSILIALFFTPLFIAFWLSILTISLYFYYKKNKFFKK